MGLFHSATVITSSRLVFVEIGTRDIHGHVGGYDEELCETRVEGVTTRCNEVSGGVVQGGRLETVEVNGEWSVCLLGRYGSTFPK